MRGEIKTWTQQKEWDHESELIADFWSPAAFRSRVPLFLCWALPAPTGTGTIALDPTFGSFTLLELFHIRGIGFFGESV